ncbi:MAG: pentapeptide repeat-containing protein [Pseudomonadales bacterium]|nr:pentapeptide repeat-containing protein [Pseudomonadales bacterium]
MIRFLNLCALFLFACAATASNVNKCPSLPQKDEASECPYEGVKLTRDDLIAVQCHAESSSVNLCKVNLRSLDLSGIDLNGANFVQAQLEGANLRGANLSGANFNEAFLSYANLKEANLSGAFLVDAHVNSANLSRANLSKAFLAGAFVSWSDLSGANLREAVLVGVLLVETNLSGADLSGADLSGANLRGAIWNVSGLPSSEKVAHSYGLESLRYADAEAVVSLRANFKERSANLNDVAWNVSGLPSSEIVVYSYSLEAPRNADAKALFNLRAKFKENGFRNQERQITYAINHGKLWRDEGLLSIIGDTIQYILFDLTTAWGLKPYRAIFALFIFIPVFSVFYIVALRIHQSDGIWQIWDENRVRTDIGRNYPLRLYRPSILQAIPLAFYFSILSAFHIGWRDFNVGNWISRLQSREYGLRATGWVRSVSGIQSLLSVYLLAMFILTHFGRPFE